MPIPADLKIKSGRYKNKWYNNQRSIPTAYPPAESHIQSPSEIGTARFLRDGVESDRGESGNGSVGSRREASVLGGGSEVFEAGLEICPQQALG
jgi:hypothetical protein